MLQIPKGPPAARRNTTSIASAIVNGYTLELPHSCKLVWAPYDRMTLRSYILREHELNDKFRFKAFGWNILDDPEAMRVLATPGLQNKES